MSSIPTAKPSRSAFTGQQLSTQAGSVLFWVWLRPLEQALAFMPGRLGYARKITLVAYLRSDPFVTELPGIRRVTIQSVLARFFQGFTSASGNRRCFRPLWHWGDTPLGQ